MKQRLRSEENDWRILNKNTKLTEVIRSYSKFLGQYKTLFLIDKKLNFLLIFEKVFQFQKFQFSFLM